MMSHSWGRMLISLLFIHCANAAESGFFTYEDLGSEVEITDYTGSETGHLEIPSTIIDKPVSIIGEEAFALGAFTGVTIPQTVRQIKRFAFQGCTSLKAVVIPESVRQIDEGAFFENYELKAITIATGDVTLGNSIFVRCGIGEFGTSDEETVVKLADGVTRLSSGMFANCRNIRHITLPDSITEVDSQVFLGNKKLSSVKLSANLQNIGASMFEDCLALSEIKIPKTVTKIGSRAFGNCDALTSIVIPASVVEMRAQAFQLCDKLARVVFLGNAPALFENADPDFFLFSLNSMFPVADDTKVGTTVYFSTEQTGFTSPTWEGFPSEALDTVNLPPAPWLIKHGLALETDLNEAPFGETLLTCYAFDCAPSSSPVVPELRLTNDTLSCTYYSAASGIVYTPQTSTSLSSEEWVDLDEASSTLNTLGERSLTLPTEEDRLFFRVVVTPQWGL